MINNFIDFLAHMLDDAMLDKSRFITEGKHWPEDYKKTAFNTIKASSLGQQTWYSDEFIQKDVDTFTNEFRPLSHKNSNLGFFATIIRWFIEYSGTSMQKYQEFIEIKLDAIIRDLQVFLNDPKLDSVKKEQLKKSSFAEFEKLQKDLSTRLKTSDVAYSGNETDDYDLLFIESYEQLHEKFGGDRTGYMGKSEWCHTNGKSTYESWTTNGTRFFFVLAKKNWKKITPPNPETTNAYDDYGTSLIAILVNQTGELLNATLRWNHIIDPSDTVAGTTVDRAFLTFRSLSDAVGMDVKQHVLQMLKQNNIFSKYGNIIYKTDETKCVIYDGHLLWVDKNDNKVETPQKINGDFNCSGTDITSLEGSPREVGGDFYCYECASLTSLEGAPKEVGGDFSCSSCKSLTSLEGSPLEVNGGFYCFNCDSLASLEGSPEEVGGDFNCSGTDITSLEGSPREVGGDFYCFNCASLTSLEGAPQKVGRHFSCSSCKSLTSLEGSPLEVNGGFYCLDCDSLMSLKGAPQKVGGDFSFKCTKITADQKQDYLNWLKTNPRQNYRELSES